MKPSLTRRDFLEGSGRLLAGLGAASLVSAAPAGPQRPPLTPSCRDPHLKLTGEKDCWSALRKIGAEGVEATIDEDLSFPVLFHPDRKYSAATPEGIRRLAADLQAAGQKITAFCTYNRFDERPEFEIDWGTKVARAAQALGVKAIRIDVVPRKLAKGEFLKSSIRTLGKLLEATESTGVAFGIENHGNTTNDPRFLKALFGGVGSPRLGLTLDTGNFYWFGHPLSKLYEIFETFAFRVFHTHCKNIKFPEAEREKQRPMGWEYEKYTCPIYEGDVDFRRLVAILRKAGYANDLCVEDESLGRFPPSERAEILAKEIRFLKSVG